MGFYLDCILYFSVKITTYFHFLLLFLFVYSLSSFLIILKILILYFTKYLFIFNMLFSSLFVLLDLFHVDRLPCSFNFLLYLFFKFMIFLFRGFNLVHSQSSNVLSLLFIFLHTFSNNIVML